ncbi:PTS sugar transporter subunit IIA [Wukongibacter sp. M2B1]|uniref:PTS sugar transporter subunit IIA n=1 Tax=Wukongibacter sp. M2B1 TaxID=3088895 RepID=UPI003D7B8652
MLSLFKRNKEVVINSPFEGEIVDILDVNDLAFSEKILGDGFAVIPSSNVALAPCDGRVTQIFHTNHAFGITTNEGLEILVHIGLDTVKLEGKGFKRLVEVGNEIKKGTGIIEVNLDYIKNSGKDIITPVVITNMEVVKNMVKDFNSNEDVLRVDVRK